VLSLPLIHAASLAAPPTCRCRSLPLPPTSNSAGLLIAALGSAFLVGCGGGATTGATTTKTVTVTAAPSSAEQSSPSSPGPYPLGKEVSLVGNGEDLAVTVYAVDQNSVPDAPKPQSPGHRVGADVRLCVNKHLLAIRSARLGAHGLCRTLSSATTRRAVRPRRPASSSPGGGPNPLCRRNRCFPNLHKRAP
jgi:hypothetical protein